MKKNCRGKETENNKEIMRKNKKVFLIWLIKNRIQIKNQLRRSNLKKTNEVN